MKMPLYLSLMLLWLSSHNKLGSETKMARRQNGEDGKKNAELPYQAAPTTDKPMHRPIPRSAKA